MLAQLKSVWVKVRDSLWFLPALFTVIAAALAVVLIELERSGFVDFPASRPWLWAVGADGALSVLSAIAGGLITVTGVVFSVTIVALQLASSQFTPRLLRNFTADRTNHLVLAVLIGTFTYTLLVLRVIETGSETAERFVPRLAVSIAVGLALLSIGFLIHYIDHAARSIQISVVLERVTRQTIEHIDHLFPEAASAEGDDEPGEWSTRGAPRIVEADRSGYLQTIDAPGLHHLAAERGIRIRMEPRIGAFIMEGSPLTTVWPEQRVDDEIVGAIRLAFVLGTEPTPEWDVEFGIIEVSDIAVKALSPAVNDPTTALRCIDRLGEMLVAVGTRRLYPRPGSPDPTIRFLQPVLDFDRVVGLAFDPIHHVACGNPVIASRVVTTMEKVIGFVPPQRRPPLERRIAAIIGDARGSIDLPSEREAFERMMDGRRR